MADDTHDIGAIWGKVENLESNFKSLGDQVTSGFDRVFRILQDNSEKTEKRINDLQTQTSTKLDAVQNNYQQTSAQRSATALTIIGYLLTGIIGLGTVGGTIVGLAVTFYTLTKAPIDDAFKRQETEISANTASITDILKQQEVAAEKVRDRFDFERQSVDAKFKDYVPREEVTATIGALQERQKSNIQRIDDLERFASVSMTDRIALHQQIDELRENWKATVATIVPRPENENRFEDLTFRINKLFDRLNIVQQDLADGSKVGDRINRLNDEFETLINKFVVLPSFPTYSKPMVPAAPKE